MRKTETNTKIYAYKITNQDFARNFFLTYKIIY